MFELTDKEFEFYLNNAYFRCACENAFRNGFTKEQALSELCIHLLKEKEAQQEEMLNQIMNSSVGFIPSFEREAKNNG